MNTPTEQQVLNAADAIVAAFEATDTDAYFAGFAEDASFIFHPEDARLNSRAEYEKIWAGWLKDGWRVTACTSSDRLVQTFPGGAVFSHTVATSIDSNGGPDSYVERETIVFKEAGGGSLVAIHEHLSTVPESAIATAAEEVSA